MTVSDNITANNVTLRKVNSTGLLRSLDDLEPLPMNPPVNALDEPIAITSDPLEAELLEKRKHKEELRHKEILFKIERYAISLFALFFLVFNAVYWVDLLYSAKFSER